MKKSSIDKIKTKGKSKPRSATITPVPKPRRTKSPLSPTEQAEYINIIPPREAAAAACAAPLVPSFDYHYSYSDSPYGDLTEYGDLAQTEYYPETQQTFDSEKSEYANLLLQDVTEDARTYLDPEGFTLTIPKKQTEYEACAYSDNPYGESTQVGYHYPKAQQSFDSKQSESESEYANLLLLGEAEKGTRIYLDPESNYITISGKKTEHAASFSPAVSEVFSNVSVGPMKAKKKRSKKPAMTPKIDEVQYATLGLTQPDYANVIQEKKLGTVEYHHLGSDNLLTPISVQQEKQSELTTKKPMITPSLTRRKVIKRKQNRSKDNYPGSLSTAFGKLDISTIQEEQTVAPERKSDSAVNQANPFSFFFPKGKAKNTEGKAEIDPTVSNFSSSVCENK